MSDLAVLPEVVNSVVDIYEAQHKKHHAGHGPGNVDREADAGMAGVEQAGKVMGGAGALLGAGGLLAGGTVGAALGGVGTMLGVAALPIAALVGGYKLGGILDKEGKISDNLAAVHKEDFDARIEAEHGMVNQDQRGLAGIGNANRKMKAHNPDLYFAQQQGQLMHKLKGEAEARDNPYLQILGNVQQAKAGADVHAALAHYAQ